MINRPIEGVARPPSSSPAVGTNQRHVIEQQAIVERAFA
jgi:2-oxoglutarate dehydrogenase complex dehydrogenase (E1) component-like enzyme